MQYGICIRLDAIFYCMKLLKRSLGGQYVVFGVFALYNDEALGTAVRSVINLILSVPFHEILVSLRTHTHTHTIDRACAYHTHITHTHTSHTNVIHTSSHHTHINTHTSHTHILYITHTSHTRITHTHHTHASHTRTVHWHIHHLLPLNILMIYFYLNSAYIWCHKLTDITRVCVRVPCVCARMCVCVCMYMCICVCIHV